MQHKRLKLSIVFLLDLTDRLAQESVASRRQAGVFPRWAIPLISCLHQQHRNWRFCSTRVQQPYEIWVATAIEEAIGISFWLRPIQTQLPIILYWVLMNLIFQIYHTNCMTCRKTFAKWKSQATWQALPWAILWLLPICKSYSGNKEIKTFKIVKN